MWIIHNTHWISRCFLESSKIIKSSKLLGNSFTTLRRSIRVNNSFLKLMLISFLFGIVLPPLTASDHQSSALLKVWTPADEQEAETWDWPHSFSWNEIKGLKMCCCSDEVVFVSSDVFMFVSASWLLQPTGLRQIRVLFLFLSFMLRTRSLECARSGFPASVETLAGIICLKGAGGLRGGLVIQLRLFKRWKRDLFSLPPPRLCLFSLSHACLNLGEEGHCMLQISQLISLAGFGQEDPAARRQAAEQRWPPAIQNPAAAVVTGRGLHKCPLRSV